ncbi:hypothetical protein BJA01nite_36840 [Bradyrhizobium japonicum]|nr:hypothetical protein BJ6T_20810 [Bradyrhizobium japonicum USDA 6]GEC46042.1 hypothetical protein BJA01nite_36840 [Bradyrhizobium japonicum]
MRYGDFSEPDTLLSAFDGGRSALIISTMPPGTNRVAQHRNAFGAARRAGVHNIAYTSYPNPVEGNPAPPVASHRASEADLTRLDVGWTVLRNALFSDWRLRLAQRYIAQGQWTTNIGDGAHAYVTRRDCAEAAAAVLIAKDSRHHGQTYELTGPALLGRSDILSLLEEFGRRSIKCVQVNDDDYERYRVEFEADPANSEYFELWTATGEAIRRGYLNQHTTAVRDLTGLEPISLRCLFEQRELDVQR